MNWYQFLYPQQKQSKTDSIDDSCFIFGKIINHKSTFIPFAGSHNS